MTQPTFIEVFIEIYNAGAAFIIIFLIGQIIFMMRKIDKDVLKARVFLNDEIMQNTWTYISIAGAAFAFNTLIAFMKLLMGIETFTIYVLYGLTQIIFVLAFILAVYNWYVFIGSFSERKILLEKKLKR